MTDRELMQKMLNFLETRYLVMCSSYADHKDMLADVLRKRLAQPDQWQGLTEAEKINVAIDCGCADVAWMDFADAIEAKLKEKNT